MSCRCKKTEIEIKVITALRVVLKKSNITRASRFGREIDIDEFAKRGLFFEIKRAVDDPKATGCRLEELSPDDFVKFRKVSDIINAVSNEFGCEDL